MASNSDAIFLMSIRAIKVRLLLKDKSKNSSQILFLRMHLLFF